MLRSGFVYCAYGGRSSFALLLLLIFFTALERENLIFLFISHAPRRLQSLEEAAGEEVTSWLQLERVASKWKTNANGKISDFQLRWKAHRGGGAEREK